MKKIIKPYQKEEAIYQSDFTGKCFGTFYPEVEVKLNFNYGSKYDGAEISIHLSDNECLDLLNLIKLKLSEDKKNEFKKLINNFETSIEEGINFRSPDGLNELYNNKSLYEFLLDLD